MAGPFRTACRARGRPGVIGALAPAVAGALAWMSGLAVALPAAGQPGGQPAGPSEPAGGDRYEGRPIREIVLRRPPVREGGRQVGPGGPLEDRLAQLARNQLRLVEGVPFNREQAAADLRALNRLGRFGTVQSEVQQLADGSVRVIYTLEPQPIVQAVQTVGNRKFTDDALLSEIGLIEGAAVDRFVLDRIARRLEEKYRRDGYYLVKVDWDEDALAESGIVLFRIREGDMVRVTQIRFEGNASLPPGELRSRLSTEEAWLFGRGYVNDEVLDADVAALVEHYRSRGFLDVRADRVVRPAPNGREVSVTFLIEEGPRFTLRDVRAVYLDAVRAQFATEAEALAAVGEGEEYAGIWTPDAGFRYVVYRPEPFSTEQVRGLMGLKRGDVYGTTSADASVEDVRSALHALGHTDARVRRVERRSVDGAGVDLLLEIVPGPVFRAGLVSVTGNSITQDRVVRRRLTVRPDRPLDRSELEESRRALEATNLFHRDRTTGLSSVRGGILSPDPSDPRYRDVLFEVEETNTGNFNVGAAVDSDAGLSARMTVSQRNFDIWDFPDSWGDLMSGRAFRGAGQTARLDILPGTRYQTYSTSLTEPSLFDSDYSGTLAFSYRQRNYRQYDEERVGGRATVTRRFGTRWVGSGFVRLEQVGLSDLDAGSPTDFYDVADDSVLLGFGASLVRTQVDDRTRPTRGTRVELGIEQVTGDFTFTRLTAEHYAFFALREDLLGRRTVLSMRTAMGLVPQGQDETPTYERFYGGGRSFRGFDFRGISPRGVRNDNNEPSNEAVGGTWSFFWGLELEQPLYENIFSGVVFLDTGTVLEDFGFEQYRVSVGAGIRITVPMLSNVPLAFDFGFPILKEDADETRLFTFNIDVPF